MEETKGSLFYSVPSSCIAFFELWPEHPSWLQSQVFDHQALMNAVWQQFPDYAAMYNLMEQSGSNNILRGLSDGTDGTNEAVDTRNMIFLSEAGTDFLHTEFL